MKKILFTLLLAVMAIASLRAQKGEIYYKDFVPDTCQFIIGIDSLKIDIDNDSSFDMWISGYVQHGALLLDIYTMPGWEMCPSNANTILNSDTLEWMQSEAFYYHYVFTGEYFQKSIGFRKQIGDAFFYGWMFTYCDYIIDPNNIGRNVYIDKFAFCTIPDYPLHWGQTSLEWDVDENKDEARVTLHPNPTTGLVTVMGKDLKSAEVVNMLGQHVAKAQGEGERLTVDISSLPAGVYFVDITDSEGRKCVRKVVKE